MIDTDKYEDELEKLCNRAIFYEDEYKLSQREKQELIAEVKRLNRRLVEADCLIDTLQTIADNQAEEVKRLREQYTELREALVGDSPNWTHEELIERALEMSEPAELEFGEWHTDMGEEE